MSRYALLLIAVLVLGLPTVARAQTGPGDPPFDRGTAQALFDEYAEEFPALNATVMRRGEIIWEAEGGTRRGPEDGVSTDYNFYSIAKMLTGWAYARLETTQGLDLDQSIRLIDPDLPEQFQDVTLRQLLSHTSGLHHYGPGADWQRFSELRCDTPADAIQHFINDPLVTEPGSVHQYTTYGFTLLSHLLVILTGTNTFDEAMTAALGDAYLVQTDSDDAEKATNYGRLFLWYRVLNNINAECKFGGGGLIASSRDLAAMGTAFATGEIVPLDQIPALMQPFETSTGEAISYVYGMSAGYSENFQAHYALHSGGSPGGRGYLAVFVEPEISVGLTANFDGPALPDLAIGLARLAAGLELDSED